MIKNNQFNQYDKNGESDQQMFIRVSKKFAVLIFIIFTFDTLLEWGLGIAHLVIELIEYSLEVILDYGFQTGHHLSEIIIVNAVIIIALFGLYKLYKKIPKIYQQSKQSLVIKCDNQLLAWKILSLSRNIEVIFTYSLGVSTVFLLLTL